MPLTVSTTSPGARPAASAIEPASTRLMIGFTNPSAPAPLRPSVTAASSSAWYLSLERWKETPTGESSVGLFRVTSRSMRRRAPWPGEPEPLVFSFFVSSSTGGSGPAEDTDAEDLANDTDAEQGLAEDAETRLLRPNSKERIPAAESLRPKALITVPTAWPARPTVEFISDFICRNMS
eukprot:604449-Prymnesium_polylepis.1